MYVSLDVIMGQLCETDGWMIIMCCGFFYVQKELGGVVKPAESFWTLGGLLFFPATVSDCGLVCNAI